MNTQELIGKQDTRETDEVWADTQQANNTHRTGERTLSTQSKQLNKETNKKHTEKKEEGDLKRYQVT